MLSNSRYRIIHNWYLPNISIYELYQIIRVKYKYNFWLLIKYESLANIILSPLLSECVFTEFFLFESIFCFNSLICFSGHIVIVFNLWIVWFFWTETIRRSIIFLLNCNTWLYSICNILFLITHWIIKLLTICVIIFSWMH